jgi:hypothetical protein
VRDEIVDPDPKRNTGAYRITNLRTIWKAALREWGGAPMVAPPTASLFTTLRGV